MVSLGSTAETVVKLAVNLTGTRRDRKTFTVCQNRRFVINIMTADLLLP